MTRETSGAILESPHNSLCPVHKHSSPGVGGAWMHGVVALPLDIVDNFITLTVSVVFLINYIYLYFRY